MPKRTRRYRLIRAAAILLAAILILLAAFPLWFPWVLGPTARAYGATFSQYERLGYGRFRVSTVAFTNQNVAFTADRVEALVPTVWLWQRIAARESSAFLNVDSWEFHLQPRPRAEGAPVAGSVYTNYQSVHAALERVATWLPTAHLTNGVIHPGKGSLAVPFAVWTNHALSAEAVFDEDRRVTIQVDTAVRNPDARASEFRAGEAARVRLESASMNVGADVWIAEEEGEGLVVSGVGRWLTNQLQLDARFGREGMLPLTASLRAPGFTLPGTILRLEDYGELTGALVADWAVDRFTVRVDATAAPLAEDLPAVVMEAHAFGTTEFAQVDVLKVSTPWFQAHLSEATRVQFHPPFFSQPATLELSANLGEQSLIEASGTVRGKAILLPTYERVPRVPFNVAGNRVTVAGIETETLSLEGELRWPDVQIGQGEIELADGSRASLSGAFNARTRTISNGVVAFEGVFGRERLPKGYSFEHATVNARISGPIQSLSHAVTLTASNVVTPPTHPLQVAAEWSGQHLNLGQLQATIRSGNAALHLQGAAALDAPVRRVRLERLALMDGETARLELQQPAEMAFHASTNVSSSPSNSWSLRVDSFNWSGPAGGIEVAANVHWPNDGHVRVVLQELSSQAVNAFLSNPPPVGALERARFNGAWTNGGPIRFDLDFAASVVTEEQMPFAAQGQIAGTEQGITLGQMIVFSATQSVLHATGFLPVQIQPTAPEMFRSDPGGRLRFEAATDENSLLWEKVSEWSGLELQRPALRVNLDGTWQAPHGVIEAGIDRIQLRGKGREWPPVEQVRIKAELDREHARITELRGLIEGQPVEVSAELPLGQGVWEEAIRHRRIPDWRKASARLLIRDAQIAPFAGLAPDWVTPQGVINMEATIQPGGMVNGSVSLKDGRTRPIESIGPVRDIELQATLAGRSVRLEHISANVGGQTVMASGMMELPEDYHFGKTLPPFQVQLRGTNVPLARKPELLIRADLNLSVTNSGTAEPGLVAGTVRLRDSFLLSDLRDLVPGGAVASPRRRPPYFSVDVEPWADWRLNLNVEGERFLRVRSPLFRGVVSTTLRLEGTLRDPLALGEARINSGRVTFPFGSLDVRQGFVSLTSDDPYRPRLLVNAEAQRLGYDIKMEATGPADQPVVQFSSTPPLSSEQIVLMLTTGQMPQGIANSSAQRRAQGLALFVGKNLLTEFGIGDSDEERLTIRSGEHLTEAGKPTYDIEYRLGDRWSLLGEYDRFGQYNLGLKWRAYSK